MTSRHNRPAPILLYHVIADTPTSASFPNLFVAPDDFSAQMRWLAANAVELAGYLGATTTKYGLGRSQEMFTLSRIRIDGVDHLDGFAQKLQSLTP